MNVVSCRESLQTGIFFYRKEDKESNGRGDYLRKGSLQSLFK